MKGIISVVAASLLAGSVAFAGDFELGKFYVGVDAGVNNPTTKASSFDSAYGPWISANLGKAGFMYGINAGWRVPFSKSFHGL